MLAVGPAPEDAVQISDVKTGAAARFVHNSADTPAIDIQVDGAVVIAGLSYPNATTYDDFEARAGTYNVVVAAAVDPSIQPIDVEVTLEKNTSYTVIAAESLLDDTLIPLVTEDIRRNIATAAVIEVVHGAYNVAADIPVDIYLTSDGVIADAQPVIADLAYTESTGQLPLTPGDYWVTVTASDDKSIVAFDSGAALALDGKVNYTIIARDSAAGESGNPLIDVTILTD